LTDLDPDVVGRVAAELSDKLDETRTEVRGRWWKDEVIDITGYRFEDCRFENCTLVFDWPHFELISCVLVQTDLLPRRTRERRQSGGT